MTAPQSASLPTKGAVMQNSPTLRYSTIVIAMKTPPKRATLPRPRSGAQCAPPAWLFTPTVFVHRGLLSHVDCERIPITNLPYACLSALIFMPGPIVDAVTQLLMYWPFAAAGFALFTASSSVWKLSTSFSLPNETLPIGQ